jgi:hypothetical protein
MILKYMQHRLWPYILDFFFTWSIVVNDPHIYPKTLVCGTYVFFKETRRYASGADTVYTTNTDMIQTGVPMQYAYNV